MQWNLSHRISKFFMRLEDILNGEERRVILFDIESYNLFAVPPRRRWEDFDWPALEATLVIDGKSYQIQAEAVDAVPEPEGGTDDVEVLR